MGTIKTLKVRRTMLGDASFAGIPIISFEIIFIIINLFTVGLFLVNSNQLTAAIYNTQSIYIRQVNDYPISFVLFVLHCKFNNQHIGRQRWHSMKRQEDHSMYIIVYSLFDWL